MNIDIKLLESDSQIRQSILSSLKPEVDALVSKSIPKINPMIKDLFKEALMNEPEYTSLKSGRLKYEFGLPQEVDIDDVVLIMSNSVNINLSQSKISSSGINVGIKIEVFEKSGEPAINSPNAFVSDTKGGYSLPWLEWLLLKGTVPIVKNYSVILGPNKFSRTGMALMVESNKNWRVPSEFAGSSSNNWASRALDKIEDKIQTQIIAIFQG
jgi:hypothetical protein